MERGLWTLLMGGLVLRCHCAHVLVIELLWWLSVKNLPAVQETWVQSLGWEDPLEKGMATHSSVLAWRIPWKEEPGNSMGSKELNTT